MAIDEGTDGVTVIMSEIPLQVAVRSTILLDADREEMHSWPNPLSMWLAITIPTAQRFVGDTFEKGF